MMPNDDVFRAIRAAVGPQGVIDEPALVEPYITEQRGLLRGNCAMVVRPASTAETAEVVRLCAGAGIPIVPQGGNTGLVGGGVPDGGIVLTTVRMNRIRALDGTNHTITVEAGCILADIQAAAADSGALFPLSLGAEGSCRIGGNLATNAGGVAVLRYGNARDLTLGIEAVLPDGRVWDGLRGLRKDNTGYDLKHLFIGAEGTLGVITAAVLKLFPQPQARETALAAAATPAALLQLFDRAFRAAGDALTAFEMIPRMGLDFSLRHMPGIVDPFAEAHPVYALVELASPRAGEALREALETLLGGALEDGVIADAVIAASGEQARELWRIRDSLPESQKFEGGSIKHDVAVPVSRIADFVDAATRLVEREIPGVRVVAFGHLGDGNIHFNLTQPEGADSGQFMDRREPITRMVHDLVAAMDGSFSAEHGIGQIKRADLERYKSAVELDLMRAVKKTLDPGGIMNPGKVV